MIKVLKWKKEKQPREWWTLRLKSTLLCKIMKRFYWTQVWYWAANFQKQGNFCVLIKINKNINNSVVPVWAYLSKDLTNINKIWNCSIRTLRKNLELSSFKQITNFSKHSNWLMYQSIESSTSPPPLRAYPGHLTPLSSLGVGNLITTYMAWGIWTLTLILCYVSQWVNVGP